MSCQKIRRIKIVIKLMEVRRIKWLVKILFLIFPDPFASTSTFLAIINHFFQTYLLYGSFKITYLVESKQLKFLAIQHCNRKQLHLQCNHLYHLYIGRFHLDHRQEHHIKSEIVCFLYEKDAGFVQKEYF